MKYLAQVLLSFWLITALLSCFNTPTNGSRDYTMRITNDMSELPIHKIVVEQKVDGDIEWSNSYENEDLQSLRSNEAYMITIPLQAPTTASITVSYHCYSYGVLIVESNNSFTMKDDLILHPRVNYSAIAVLTEYHAEIKAGNLDPNGIEARLLFNKMFADHMIEQGNNWEDQSQFYEAYSNSDRADANAFEESAKVHPNYDPELFAALPIQSFSRAATGPLSSSDTSSSSNTLSVSSSMTLSSAENKPVSSSKVSSSSKELIEAPIDPVSSAYVNRSPIVENQSFTITDKSKANALVGTIVAQDPDGDPLNYSITNDTEAFMITSSGVLRVKNADLSEHSYTIQVVVTDLMSAPIDFFIEIAVNRINDAPEMKNQSFTMPENSRAGTIVGTIIATDPEGDALEYSIVVGESNFTINSSGTLRVKDALFDYEKQATFSITARVTDIFDLSTEATITVNLEDLNDRPVISSQLFSIPENSPASTSIGQVIATDQENTAEELTYALSADTASLFSITGTGELLLKSPGLNYETTTRYGITVDITDTDGLTATADMEITVSNVNESPVIAVMNAVEVEEYAPLNSLLITVNATDPDAGTHLTYKIESGGEGAFVIDATSGELTTISDLIYTETQNYTLSIEVSDGLLSSVSTVEVSLIDLEENGTFIDSRDSREYTWTRIGGQVWMAENLNYLTAESGCYSDLCETYGRLYEWTAMMDIDKDYWSETWGGTEENWRGNCPIDWRVPTPGDWITMKTYLTRVYPEDPHGTLLKTVTGWDSNNGINAVGFNGQATSGGRNIVYESDIGLNAIYMTTSEFDLNSDQKIITYTMESDNTDLIESSLYKMYYASVRCIKKD